MSLCSWMLGIDGSKKIEMLSSHLFEKIRKMQTSLNQQAPQAYLPWQSNPEISGSIDLQSISLSENKLLIDKEILMRIRRAVFESKKLRLGKISIKSDRMLINCRPSKIDISAYNSAVALIKNAGECWTKNYNSLVKMIIPLRTAAHVSPNAGMGLSTEHMKGAVFLSVPMQKEFRTLELAINLTHEMGHQALMIYQASDSILACPFETPVFSGVRKTFRPAIHSFHALIALMFMIDFLNKIISTPNLLNSFELEYMMHRHESLHSDLHVAIDSFADISLTQIGLKLFQEAIRTYKTGCNEGNNLWVKAVSL